MPRIVPIGHRVLHSRASASQKSRLSVDRPRRAGNDTDITIRLRTEMWAIGRELEPERAAFSHLAIDADAASVQLNRVLHDREPQARPAQGPRPPLVDPVKSLEEPRQMLGLDAPAGVGDAHPNRR